MPVISIVAVLYRPIGQHLVLILGKHFIPILLQLNHSFELLVIVLMLWFMPFVGFDVQKSCNHFLKTFLINNSIIADISPIAYFSEIVGKWVFIFNYVTETVVLGPKSHPKVRQSFGNLMEHWFEDKDTKSLLYTILLMGLSLISMTFLFIAHSPSDSIIAFWTTDWIKI